MPNSKTANQNVFAEDKLIVYSSTIHTIFLLNLQTANISISQTRQHKLTILDAQARPDQVFSLLRMMMVVLNLYMQKIIGIRAQFKAICVFPAIWNPI